ncbi:MAG: hypothetical protein KDA87_16765 [Planctomycetales bacterium]|nr:hypothetical protein [Planctomycetales bacterium]
MNLVLFQQRSRCGARGVIALSVICFGVLQNAICAQEIFVYSPLEYQDVEGPDAADVTDFPNYRFQHIYDIRGFQELEHTGPVYITHMDWRLDGALTEPIDYPSEWLLTLSTTDKTPGNLSLTFADNLGDDEKIVFDHAFVLDSTNEGPAGGPKVFDYGIELDEPFLYDPSKGHLLADFTVRNGVGPLLLDYDFGAPQFTQQIFAADPDATEAFSSGAVGHITRLTVVPVPEPNPHQLVIVGLALLFWLRRRNH